MAKVVRTFISRVPAPPEAVHPAVCDVLTEMKATVEPGNPIHAAIPRSLAKGRAPATVTVEVRRDSGAALVGWTVDQGALLGLGHDALIGEITGALPWDIQVFEVAQPGGVIADPVMFKGIALTAKGELVNGAITYPVNGARASVDLGAPNSRITATRVIAVGVFALAAKKDNTKVFVSVELADGQTLVVEGKAKQDETAARAFAAAVNTQAAKTILRPGELPPLPGGVAAQVTRQTPPAAPPPPPAVPAGWYPDGQNQALQRYWDGTGWTEHTAPR